MRKPLESVQLFAQRRARLAEKMAGSAMVLTSLPEALRNGNYHLHPYRQDSNLYYLTGFEEPDSILIFRPGQIPETVMFVREKNVERETWDGFRFGPAAVESEFKIDKAYPIEAYEKEAPKLLKGMEKLYYRFYRHPEFDKKMEHILGEVKNMAGRSGHGYLAIHDSFELLGELRVKKTEAELQNMRRACELSAQTHLDTMRYIKPGMSEREVHGYMLYQFMKRGAAREGYNGIIAAGDNATTLHYNFNDQPLKAGELLLIDAAGEFNYFTSDITRTYPISGKFNDAQAAVYAGVLKVQKAIIDMVKPGVKFQALHDMGASLLTDLQLELGLLTGRKDDIMKANEHRKYYPHGIGHFLGMDVHDSGLYLSHKGEQREIEENMTFTVEPGLYIPANDKSAPAEFRGIGVRIEDNIRVTISGHENMTIAAPKEIADLEKTIGTL